MRPLSPIRSLLPLLVLIHTGHAATPAPVTAKLEFNRDIRPILSENCFQCHGQDAQRREAKLRLDERESAVRDRDGYSAILPGKPGESEVIRRIQSKDADESMPPPETNKKITADQAALLKRWIAEGAAYQPHWAFIAPRRVALPAVRAGTWPRHAVDRFILARLEREGLAPSAATAPATWLRRVGFDLTGLPPTPAELDRFESDVKQRGEAAYAAAADRLLASPHFGERLALDWLDAARYADTHGFNNDSSRSMWRWRDWVIEAFNSNKPYDRFITEQLAGDLLPAPTLDQRIATGFNRNHVINSEGGIIDEEYRVEYVADRVRTVSTTWLGLTMECCRCHDHKFDPVTQRDYYRLFAFFNNVPEHGEDGRVANAVPMLPAPTREQQAALAKQERDLAALDLPLAAARKNWRWRDEDKSRIEALIKAVNTTMRAEKEAVVVEIPPAKTTIDAPVDPETAPTGKTTAPKIPAAKLDFSRKDGLTLALWLRPDADNPREVALFSSMDYAGSPAATTFGKGVDLRLIDGELELRLCDRYPAYAVIVRTAGARLQAGEWHHVAVSYAGGKKAAAVRFHIDATEIATDTRYDDLISDPPKREFLVGTDTSRGAARWQGKIEDVRSFPRAASTEALRTFFNSRALTEALAAIETNSADETQLRWLREALLADQDATRESVAKRTALAEVNFALRRSLPTTMVMTESAQPRPAFVLNRGRYDAPTDPVEAGVPETLLSAWPQGAPRNRLGFARWLTHADHPLTARVVVNRFWAQLFGTGLVKTLEDFGSQGEWPSHPELLDWLARDFVDGGWNVKTFFKSLVLSATYRQSSAVTPVLVARDPENRLLARGPRLRLPAELIRDQALAVSGLLTPRIGGPSVYPYQPEKLYEGLVVGATYPGTVWGKGEESDLYRRSLYTFWKRTVPHPAMTTFDAPDREFCTVRRSRTNTPLQALTLWNEPGYLEAARRLATRMLRDVTGDTDVQIAFAFRAATGRRPQASEIAVLRRTWETLRADFAAHPADAEALLKIGTSPIDPSIPPAELAAATSVASMILTLDETITKN
ncbi:MAG: DUF1553 domain-containing protein [Opitutus sp.]|nr:DUF1553 domain-containing protein [Opitutus sp.]